MMDRFFAPHAPEAIAHWQVTENHNGWDMDHASLDEALIAQCASYQAFSRYLSGADLFITPRTKSDLEHTLRRYAYDAIHNIIAKARNPMQTGGYSRICHMSEQSIRNTLNKGDNAAILIALHTPPPTEQIIYDIESAPRFIRSN